MNTHQLNWTPAEGGEWRATVEALPFTTLAIITPLGTDRFRLRASFQTDKEDRETVGFLEGLKELAQDRFVQFVDSLAPSSLKVDLNGLARTVHAANIKWWQDVVTGLPIKRNKGELLALIHSEISEALEGERKNLVDDKLPHRMMAEVELVDAIIRILDYAAGFGYDLQGAFEDKMAFNASREDHTHEARRIAGGKQF